MPRAHDEYNQIKGGQLGWVDPATVETIENTGPNGQLFHLYPIQATGNQIKTVRIQRATPDVDAPVMVPP